MVGTTAPLAQGKVRRRFGVAILGVAALAIAATTYWFTRRTPLPELSNPRQITRASEVEGYPSWRPDATQVVYESNQNGNWDIWITQVSGGRAVNLTEDHKGEDRFPSWSPDGSQIAFYSDREGGGYFVMPALGGRPRKVSAAPPTAAYRRDAPPQWSPDGLQLAFPFWGGPMEGRREWSAEIIPLGGGASRRVALPGPENPPKGWHLSWSPDGRYLAYTTAFDEWDPRPQIWVMRLADGKGFPVTEGDTRNLSPSWSPDSRSLYFVSNRGGSMDLWRQRMAADGTRTSAPRQLTTGVEMLFARISSDGRRLVYSKGRQETNIWRVPILEDRLATWSDAQQLTDEQGLINNVALSPDRQQLMFQLRRQDVTFHLWTMAPEGGDPQRVLMDPMEQIMPRWSPDGQKIAFHSGLDIWVVAQEGGQPMRLAGHEARDTGPSWSPDGREILFYSTRSGNGDAWIVPAQGGEARQLTSDPANDRARHSWSPDGRQIAFHSSRTGNRDIWVIPSEGGEPRQLTSDPADDDWPTWSPDGRWVLFRSSRAEGRLCRVPAEGGETKVVWDEENIDPKWSPDGDALYLVAHRGGQGNLYEKTFGTTIERQLTDFAGRPGHLFRLWDTDGEFLYFTWREDVGDLWVMDVDASP